MQGLETALLTGLGLAAPAGLNAYIPLLVLALAARVTDQVSLTPPYDVLTSTPVIILLLVLLTIEVVADKVPGVDHANDLVQTIVRPAAGAILVLATTGAVHVSPAIAVPLGILTAGTVHAAKATARPAVTIGSAGMFNPLVSVGEDMLATIASVAAIWMPLLVLLFLLIFVVFVAWAVSRKAAGRAARSGPSRS